MKRLLFFFAVATLASASVARAEFRQIDLTVFGMD